jgi:hypothetical protein
MIKEYIRNEERSWYAPLPFNNPRVRLPDDRAQAINRARLLTGSLQNNPVKKNILFDL